MDNILLRNETESDYFIVETITREAFWNLYTPGCVEHYLLHVLRKSDQFIPELDYVAVLDGNIMGNIVYAKGNIAGDDGESCEVLTFGPVSVKPEFQKRGIGSRLIQHTKVLAQEMGFRAILIYGDPGYYERFGFLPAENFKIATSNNTYAVSLQALELYTGALSSCSGLFFEGSIYDVDPEAADVYDQNFSPKEKISGIPSQEKFQQIVSKQKPR